MDWLIPEERQAADEAIRKFEEAFNRIFKETIVVKRKLMIDFDSDRAQQVQIGVETPGNPWDDLAVLLEAVGCLAGIDRNSGHTTHNGKPVNEYLHSYLDKVLKDYERAYTADKAPGESPQKLN